MCNPFSLKTTTTLETLISIWLQNGQRDVYKWTDGHNLRVELRLQLNWMFPAPIAACAPDSTPVVPRSAVSQAPPSTMFRMVTGGPIKEQHLAAGQKQNNSPHAVRNPFMQLQRIATQNCQQRRGIHSTNVCDRNIRKTLQRKSNVTWRKMMAKQVNHG